MRPILSLCFEKSILGVSWPILVHGSARSIPPALWIRGPSRVWGPRACRPIGPRERACECDQVRWPNGDEREKRVKGMKGKGGCTHRLGRDGVGRARDRRGTRGSSDAHRARTAFQLAASRCRDWGCFIVGFRFSPPRFSRHRARPSIETIRTRRVSGDRGPPRARGSLRE